MATNREDWDLLLEHVRENRPLTTFEVSKICGVVHSTVSNWIDEGKLSAFKTPGGHRRIKKEFLLTFLKLHQIPVPDDLLEALEDRPAATLQTPDPDLPVDPLKKRKKVLIIEDDEGISEILFDVISRGFPQADVSRAEDGYEAGKQVATLHPDLVILDLILPGVDGFKILRNIRQDKHCVHTKIIATTGYDEIENRERILQSGGVDGFLTKPLDLNTLKTKVQKLLYG